MRVLIAHNAYKQRGGEDAVVAQEAEMLRCAGHEVLLHLVENDSINSPYKKVITALDSVYSRSSANSFKRICEDYGPDLVHIHNFFPIISLAVHQVVSTLNIPLVQTLHNYRLLCVNATFLRNNVVCEDCLAGSRINAVIHRCYRNSIIGSAAVAGMQRYAFTSNGITRSVDQFIVLTQFARSKFAEGGVPDDRMSVKANSVADVNIDSADTRRHGFLYVGRFAVEKGIATLLAAAWELPDVTFTLVGDGPIRKELENCASENVHFVGEKTPQQVAQYMAEAQCLVVPSLWYEGLPTTILEAYRSALPVIASDIGSLSEAVQHEKSGLLFSPGDVQNLVRCISTIARCDHVASAFGQTARYLYLEKYSPEKGLSRLIEVYEKAISIRRKRRGLAMSSINMDR